MTANTPLVETLLADAQALLDTLSTEKSALRAGDEGALRAAVARKQEQLSALTAHLGEVTSLEQLGENAEKFARLRDLLVRLREANLSNGYQIVLQRQFAQDALAALRGEDAHAGVYGGDAKLPTARNARAVAKA